MKSLKRLLGIIACAVSYMLLTFVVSCTQEEPEGPIDGTVTDNNGPITLNLTGHTATTATFSGTVNLDQFSDLFSLYEEVGIIYSLREDLEMSPLVTFAVPITTLDKNNHFEKTMSGLLHGVKYYYSSYVCANGIYKFGEVQSFTTDDVTVEISEPIVTSTTATFKGKVKIDDADLNAIGFGLAWKNDDDFDAGVKEISADIEADGSFTIVVKDLKMETEYYYASYVSQVGSEYGEVKKFTTSSVDMSVSASKVTHTSVTFTGQASCHDADKDIEYGVLYSTDENLKVGSNGCVHKSLAEYFDADGAYTIKVDGLLNDTKYYYRWYARQGSEYKYGQIQDFTTSSVSVNLSVDPITQTTATFKGNYEQPDGEGFEIGVLYSTSSSDLTSDSAEKIVLSKKNFSHKISGLKYNTTYYCCYYVYQKGKYTYGSAQEFKTKDVLVEVSVSGITQTTATFIGQTEITESGAIEVGILYSSNSSLSLSSSSTKKKVLNNGNFSFTAEGLTNNTKYYYKYYIKQGDDYVYGKRMDFMTTSISATLNQPSVTQTTAIFRGQTNFSDTGSIEFGILYSTLESLSFNGSGVNKLKVDSLSDGEFSCKAEGLIYSTKYYYCYYASQDGSYIYGKVNEFTTSSVPVDLSVDTVTQTTATFNGNVELTEGGLIEIGVLYSTGNNLTVGASGVNKQVLTPDSSGNVSFKAEELQYDTPYNYCYYVCQNEKYTYGSVKSFTTSSVNMSLSVNSVTQTTATFNGSVELTEDRLIEVGILYSTSTILTAGTSGVTKQALTPDSFGNVSFKVEGLQQGTSYNYCYYVCQDGKYTYGSVKSFTTSSVNMNLSVNAVTQTTATFSGNVELTEDGVIEVGLLYSTGNNLTNGASGVNKQVLTPDSSGNVSFKVEGLQHGTSYNYCYYVCQDGKYTYGTSQGFTTQSVKVNISVDSVTQTTATLIGNVELTEEGAIEVGVLYSTKSNLLSGENNVFKISLSYSSTIFNYVIEPLTWNSVYYYRYYIYQNGIYVYGDIKTFDTSIQFITPSNHIDLSEFSTSNCYIVSSVGKYCFKICKGNSNEVVGVGPNLPNGCPCSASVLWESYGTTETPNVGDLIKEVSYKSGYITFQTADEFKTGNVLIAIKDDTGTILWSWHIWFTSEPSPQTYNNDATVVMMDRNLGATSNVIGKRETWGLYYQWGRKDPFLPNDIASSVTWPIAEYERKTLEYATMNPMTFIAGIGNGVASNESWLSNEKTIYDPCPLGWRMPHQFFLGSDEYTCVVSNGGMSFSQKFASSEVIWYPISGCISGNREMHGDGYSGTYWTGQYISNDYGAAVARIFNNERVLPDLADSCENGFSVRCIKE